MSSQRDEKANENEGHHVFNEAEKSIINTARDATHNTAILPEPTETTNLIWSIATSGLGVLGFISAGVDLYKALKQRVKNKPTIFEACIRLLANGALIGLGVVGLVIPSIVMIIALCASIIVALVGINQFVIAIKQGAFSPITNNKLKISNTIIQLLGVAAVLGLAAVAVGIPGLAPIFAVVAASIVLFMSIYQLISTLSEFGAIKATLKKVGNELSVLKKIAEPTPEQKIKLEALQIHYDQLSKKDNWSKKIDMLAKSALAFGGLLTTIGLGLIFIVPPAGFVISSIGIVIGTVSVGLKELPLLIKKIQKKMDFGNPSTFNVAPPKKEALLMRTFSDQKNVFSQQPHQGTPFFSKEEPKIPPQEKFTLRNK